VYWAQEPGGRVRVNMTDGEDWIRVTGCSETRCRRIAKQVLELLNSEQGQANIGPTNAK
jgi:hypothetical protein